MQRFTKHTGKAVAIDRPNIDTDQIIPKNFLKRIERTGYGAFLFNDWRFSPDGEPNCDFVLNDPRYGDSSILIAGANFGCGSSREHAPWSLMDYGFRAIIAPSFADIFYSNSLKNGLLPVVLNEEVVTELTERAKLEDEFVVTIDLEARSVSDNKGTAVNFEIDEFQRYCLMNGLDDIELTLQHESQISDFEKKKALSASL